MSKDLSGKYYQDNKERLQKKLLKDIRVFQKKNKKKKQQYGPDRYRKPPEDGNQKLVSIEKDIAK